MVVHHAFEFDIFDTGNWFKVQYYGSICYFISLLLKKRKLAVRPKITVEQDLGKANLFWLLL